MNLKIKLLNDRAKLPEYSSIGAACMDLYASDDFIIKPRTRKMVTTGIASEIPEHHCALVFSRSGHGVNGVRLANSVAVIDSDYRGEWMCMIENYGRSDFRIAAGNRIAQFMLMPVLDIDIVPVDELNDTVRADGGFGSTGA